MKSRTNLKRAVAAVAVGVIIGGGVTIVTPAGAEVSQFAATNWKKIWKKKLQPLADKRYYKKSASDAKYSTKTEVSAAFANYYTKAQTDAALGGYYTKAQADAKYQPVGNYAAAGSSYTKNESDLKYAAAPALIRGVFIDQAGDGDGIVTADIAFGVTLEEAPTTHYIPSGAPVPVGCSGTVGNPNAAPGHLCVFGSGSSNVNTPFVFDPTLANPASTTFGASIVASAAGAGIAWFRGSWALRPAALGTVPPAAAAQGINKGAPAEGLLK